MNAPAIAWIRPGDPPDAFPPLESALDEPNGLLAAGGDLSEQRLLYAYQRGIFPWFEKGQPILWWSPDPRCILQPGALHLSRRTRRALRNSELRFSFNRAFDQVIRNCATDRAGQRGTWITKEMRQSYSQLHEAGWAHSAEIWLGTELVGGMYGLAIGKAFFGESMFSRGHDGSKAALMSTCNVLVNNDFLLLDCQIESAHLRSLGATSIARSDFAAILVDACRQPERFSAWPDETGPVVELVPGRL